MPKKIIAIACAMVLALTVSAAAQPGGMMGMAQKLGLTDQQITQLENLMLQHQKEMVKMRADLQLARLDLKEVMMKDKIDEKAALSRQDRISDIQAGIARQKLENKIAMMKVLNADQLAQWKKMRRAEGPGGRHHRDGRPSPFMGPGRMGMPMMPDTPEPPTPPEPPESQ